MRTFLTLILFSLTTKADWSAYRPDALSPAGFLSDHLLIENEYSFSYQIHQEESLRTIKGAQIINKDEVFSQGYSYAPNRWQSTTHRFHIAWGVNDQTTYFAEAGFRLSELEVIDATSAKYNMLTQGAIDPELGFTSLLWKGGRNNVISLVSLSLPLGSTTNNGFINGQQRLPYIQQLGSGSIGLGFGLKYLGQVELLSWGFATKALLPINENTHGYQKGPEFWFEQWLSWQLLPGIASALRFEHYRKSPIYGEDKEMNTSLSPLMRSDSQSYHLTQLGWNFTFFGDDFDWPGHRIQLEWLFVGDQFTEGTQFRREHNGYFRYQFVF